MCCNALNDSTSDPGTSPVGNMTRNELKELVLNSVQTAVDEVRALSVKTGLKKNIRVDRRTAVSSSSYLFIYLFIYSICYLFIRSICLLYIKCLKNKKQT